MGDDPLNNSRSWSVAWICSFINFLLLGVARLSGLLYLAAIDRYEVDRSQASLPFVLCNTVRNISGPLIGYIGRKVELRIVIAIGCFLAALGVGVCFFAEDILTVTILWGGVYGLGFGLGTILIPQVLNQHFNKYISNANGIAFGGECVAGFVLPVFVEFLLNTYGTSGSFLILSGLILHGVPAALLLKSPSTIVKTSSGKDCNETGEHSKATNSKESYNPKDYAKPPKRKVPADDNPECNPLVPAKEIHILKASAKFDNTTHVNQFKASLLVQPHIENLDNVPSSTECADSKPSCVEQSINKHSNVSAAVDIHTVIHSQDHGNSIHSYGTIGINTQSDENSSRKNCGKVSEQTPDDSSKRKSTFLVFLDPPYILILLTQSSMIFIGTTIMTIIVDYSRDVGVLSNQQVYVLMCLAISDMLGRFGLGWVTDGGYMSNITFSAVCFACMGFLMVALVFLRGFAMMMFVVFLFGLFLGGLLIVCPGIVFDYIEKDKVTMALASRFVLYAPMSLTQSSLIGFFRGKLGSYKGLFYILGVTCLLCCLFSLFIPCAARLKRNRENTVITESTENTCHRNNIAS